MFLKKNTIEEKVVNFIDQGTQEKSKEPRKGPIRRFREWYKNRKGSENATFHLPTGIDEGKINHDIRDVREDLHNLEDYWQTHPIFYFDQENIDDTLYSLTENIDYKANFEVKGWKSEDLIRRELEVMIKEYALQKAKSDENDCVLIPYKEMEIKENDIDKKTIKYTAELTVSFYRFKK